MHLGHDLVDQDEDRSECFYPARNVGCLSYASIMWTDHSFAVPQNTKLYILTADRASTMNLVHAPLYPPILVIQGG